MMTKRRIQGQVITETDDCLFVNLRQPFWGAWKVYGWKMGCIGFGIGQKIVELSKKLNKPIVVSYSYGQYRITADKLLEVHEKYKSTYTAKGGTKLLVTPKDSWEKVR